MWTSTFDLKQDPIWGSYHSTIDAEAAAVLSGQNLCLLANQFSVIEAQGEEAQTFLQGQLTCDYQQVAQQRLSMGAHCNVKGRIQSSFLTWGSEDRFYLAMPTDTMEQTLKELNKFALFSKVELQPVEDIFLAGFRGDSIESQITDMIADAKIMEDLNSGLLTATPIGNLVKHHSLGYLALISSSQLQDFAAATSKANIDVAGENAWQLHLIHQGVAFVGQALTEKLLPHELNYDLIGGVSFSKGCYKGQEIVARMEYRGKPKTRTFGLRIDGSSELKVGDKFTLGNQSAVLVALAVIKDGLHHGLVSTKVDGFNDAVQPIDQHSTATALPMIYAIPS